MLRDVVDAVLLALLVAAGVATVALARLGTRVDQALFGLEGVLVRG